MRWQRYVLLALIIVLFPVQFGVATRIEHYRQERQIAQPPIPFNEIDITQITGIALGALFAGFRSQAADIIWWRVNQYFEGAVHRCLPLMKIAVALNPFFSDFWMMLGWHEAYNLAAEEEIAGKTATHPPEYWIRQGMADLREGLKYNPGDDLLYKEAAYTAMGKAGELQSSADMFRMAWLTWRRRKGWTEEGAVIYPRMAAHALERIPDFEQALHMYDFTIRTQGQDGISPGAITTIREYYIPALRAWEAGDIDRALELNRQQLLADPSDPLGLHFRATMLEQKGDLDAALAAWEAAGMDWSNHYAQRKVAEIYIKTGRDVVAQEYLGQFVDQVAINRLVRQGLRAVGGIGLALDFAYDAIMPMGSTVTALMGTDINGNPVSGTVRFYVNGLEVARRDKPPYSINLTQEVVGNVINRAGGHCVIKAETHIEGEPLPRWDMRELTLRGTL